MTHRARHRIQRRHGTIGQDLPAALKVSNILAADL
jgi:hypothetical protein